MQRAYWDDEVSVLSAENVFFEIETAGLAARFGATLIDLTIQILVAGLCGVAFGIVDSYLAPMQNMALWMVQLLTAFSILLLFLIFYGYYFFFEWLWDGQTPGKRLTKLRVMQADGMPITYWHALIRNVLRIADFLPFFYGAGALVALLNDNNRRIGDLVAGTVVARERGDLGKNKPLDIRTAIDNFLGASTSAPQPQQDIGVNVTPVQVAEPDAATAALMTQLDAQDYELVRDFVTRRDNLPAAARNRLAFSLSRRLSAKLRMPMPEEALAEQFLLEIANRLRGRM